MFDIVSYFLSPNQIREATIALNFLSAVMIGPFLAFAVTPGASFKCPLALLRMAQRVAMGLFSIVLMYNCAFIVMTDRIPTGTALLINIGIFVTTALSGLRHYLAPPIPGSNTWSTWWEQRHPSGSR